MRVYNNQTSANMTQKKKALSGGGALLLWGIVALVVVTLSVFFAGTGAWEVLVSLVEFPGAAVSSGGVARAEPKPEGPGRHYGDGGGGRERLGERIGEKEKNTSETPEWNPIKVILSTGRGAHRL